MILKADINMYFQTFGKYVQYKLEYGILDNGIKLEYGIQMRATRIFTT